MEVPWKAIPYHSFSVSYLLNNGFHLFSLLPISLPSTILQIKQDVSLESSQPKVNNNENVGN